MSSNIDELLKVSKCLTKEYLSQQLTNWFNKPTEYAGQKFGEGTGKGDSYLSDVYRVTVFGKSLDSGKQCEIKLIIKALPKNIAIQKTFRSKQFFKNEVSCYMHIFPALLKFQAEKNVKRPFDCLPKLFAAVADGENDFIALEDLTIYNFTGAARQEGIDYDHVKIILETFARYHAISFAFKDQKPEEFAAIKPTIFETYYHENHWNWYKRYWKTLCACVIHAVSTEYPGTIYEEKIKEFAVDQAYFNAVKITSWDVDTAVYTHGDSWTPNFLVRYNPDTNKPEQAKMIDFQLARCASPTTDIVFFIYATTDQELRKQRYQDMLKYYHDVLSDEIRQMGTDPDKVYSWDTFMDEIKKNSRFGLTFAMESTPAIILDPEEAYDMDSITGTEAVDVADVWVINPIKKKEGRLRLAGIVVHAVDNGYI